MVGFGQRELTLANGSPRLSVPGELDTFCNHKTLLYVLFSLYVLHNIGESCQNNCRLSL